MWKVYCGDNVTVMRENIPDESVDLTVTSPPYDNLRSYKGFDWDFEALAHELYRVTKPGGVVVWVVGDATIKGSETGTSFRQALYFKDEVEFNLHDTMVYGKNAVGACGSKYSYQQAFEFMFILTKGKIKTFNPIKDLTPKTAGKPTRYTKNSKSTKNGYTTETHIKLAPKRSKRQNIWFYNIGFSSGDDKTEHSAVFPEQLARDHIISWSDPGDTILDPFAGSGTTLKMAEILQRNSIGIEISEEYCEIIKERMRNVEPANEQVPLF